MVVAICLGENLGRKKERIAGKKDGRGGRERVG